MNVIVCVNMLAILQYVWISTVISPIVIHLYETFAKFLTILLLMTIISIFCSVLTFSMRAMILITKTWGEP